MDSAMKERLIEEAKQRDFREILDRSTPPADPIALRDEIMKVGIVEAGTLRGLVDSMFEKAVAEPATQKTIAELCQAMPAHFEPPAPEAAPAKERGAGSRGTSEKRIDFRLMVVKKAKDELEKGTNAVKACKAWDAKEHAAGKNAIKGDDKVQMEADRAAKKRLRVAIQFCGHLYNNGMVTEKIINSILDMLLKDEDDPHHEDVESLSALLKTIGAKFDCHGHTTKEGKIVTKYFDKMAKMKENAVSKQIAELMTGIMNLRTKGWEQ